jgi:hypothetical protein
MPERLTSPEGWRLRVAVLALIVGAGCGVVVSTHRVFSATADEPQHIVSGVEWLSGRSDLWRDSRITYYILNPPLARLAVAVGPWLGGLRLTGLRDQIYAGSGYWRNLGLARIGVVPFFALAIVLVWAWARRLSGEIAGLIAAALFAATPLVLAHAGLATTDMIFAAVFALAMLSAARWLESPNLSRALQLGLVFGLAISTKLSAILLGPILLVVALMRHAGGDRAPVRPVSRTLAELGLAALVAALVIWGAYRFSWGSPRAVADPAAFTELVETCFSGDRTRALVTRVLSQSMPAPEFADALLYLCYENAPGRTTSYLLGKITQDGFPAFFWVALAVKTPLPLLVLAVAGAVAIWRRKQGGPVPRWQAFIPLTVLIVGLVAVTPSTVNIGARHILWLYPFIAVLAAVGVEALWAAGRRRAWARGAAAGLVVWQLATPVLAHPDHLAYFNLLAGREPDRVLLDSDLDWGQDLGRLESLVAERHIDDWWVAYFGPSNLCRHQLPPARWLPPQKPVTGWVAISEMYAHGLATNEFRGGDYCSGESLMARPDPDAYAWLRRYAPVARAGRSIRLYYISP